MPSAALVVRAAVRVVERLEHLQHDVEAELRGQPDLLLRQLAEELRDVEALDVLHRDEEPTLLAAEVEGLHDVACDSLAASLASLMSIPAKDGSSE
jgi:hypothetical protein